MLARDLITDDVPPLKTSDSGLKALSWMDEFKVAHLPIVNNVELLGLISESDILDLNAPEEALGNHKLSLMRPFLDHGVHIYEVIRIVAGLKLTLIPVLDEKDEYLGNITLSNLVQRFAGMAAISDPGGIIVLELNANDYAMSEISRIVEDNNAKILSSYVTSESNSTRLDLTLKLNKSDLSQTLAAFARYSYTVKASFHESTAADNLKERYDLLMNYLNI